MTIHRGKRDIPFPGCGGAVRAPRTLTVTMSIVVSAFTVVVPVRTLDALWPGGEPAYRDAAPNGTYRCDGQLSGVAFMAPPDVRAFVEGPLAERGLRYGRAGRSVDLAVVDPMRGPIVPCDWLSFHRHAGWAEARLVGAPEVPVAGPSGWTPGREDVHLDSPEGSAEHVEFLELREGRATLLDHRTGRQVYMGLTSPDGLSPVLEARLDALHDRLSALRAAADATGPSGLDPESRRAVEAVAAEAGRMLRASPRVRSRALYVTGLALRMLGQWERAVPVWQAFTGREPGFVGGWMELTWCCAEAGLRDEALRAARKAVEAGPEEPGAWANLGAALLALGRRDEALAWIGRALAARPDDPVTWRLRRMAEGEPLRES